MPFAALLMVLALIWLIQRLIRLARRHTVLAPWLPQAARAPRRLRLAESLAIDTRRRVVLVACDDRDVLVLIGGPNDLVLATLPGSR